MNVEAHSAHQNLESIIRAALVAAGKDPERFTADDLVPVDEFHVRGRKATEELARSIGPQQGMRVLDVGCGLGGASRYLAREFGCRVIGLDLNSDYIRVAADLTRRLCLDSLVSFRQGNALELPFPDDSFDIVWTQHAGMSIADKTTLYREMGRVLRPGGKLALYDVLAGAAGEAHYPVPWARSRNTSFLVTPEQLRKTLVEAGLEIVTWRDVTEPGREWFRGVEQRMARDGAPPFSPHLLLGDDFRLMAHNQFRNLEEERITLIEVVANQPAPC